MNKGGFEADIYGIGELITQKKQFEVPLHQRDFSWGKSEVGQYVDDVISALEANYSNYFLGSIVLTKPKEANWGVLDGQQRLTTTSILYSTIRYFLISYGKEKDAYQIESEFLGLRSLGGNKSSRLKLNKTNQDVYRKIVVEMISEDDIEEIKTEKSLQNSNKLLIEAVLAARQRIAKWVKSKTKNEQEEIFKLYRLTEYLENKVLVISLEVSDEADAFVIFETLNNRGLDLSALDLVKNHIFTNASIDKYNELETQWSTMRENIGDKPADDFLRIFWMGNYGLIQKSKLFPNIKSKYSSQSSVLTLCDELSYGSQIYSAIEDQNHEIWYQHTQYSKHLMRVLNFLKSKQTRPIVYAAILNDVKPNIFEEVLWMLVVLTIRFQTIGKRRQGIIENNSAKIAEDISKAKNVNSISIMEGINKILPKDEDFRASFLGFSDTNRSKLLYFLATIEFTQGGIKSYKDCWQTVDSILDYNSNIELVKIANAEEINNLLGLSSVEISAGFFINNIANIALLEKKLNTSNRNKEFKFSKVLYKGSSFKTTSKLASYKDWDFDSFTDRADELSDSAISIWKI